MFLQPQEFDGVFRFTNASTEDFVALWNNKEYVFPAQTTCPLVIEGESMEAIQEIRKRFAKRYAEREYFKTKEYKDIANGDRGTHGDGRVVIPSSYNETVLESYIQQCLEPLPVAVAKVGKKIKDDDDNYKAAKAVGDSSNLNEVFKDAPVVNLGKM